MTSALASDSKGCYRCSDFALKAYGIDKASFSSETNFKRAIETTFERDISFGFMCGYNDKYDCVGIDYLPKELHKTFLKAFNDTYEDKSPAVKSSKFMLVMSVPMVPCNFKCLSMFQIALPVKRNTSFLDVLLFL